MSQTIERMLQALRPQVQARVWLISDLQQSVPERACRCLTTAVEDFQNLDMPPDRIWYLGDATEGTDIAAIGEMVEMQVEMLTALGVPLRYVIGNHDFDYWRRAVGAGPVVVPFLDAVKRTPGWETTPTLDAFHFVEELAGHLVVFLSDHADPDGAWLATFGKVFGQSDAYPHDQAAYDALRARIAQAGKPVITAAHYAFAGGNRDSESGLLNPLLPLPENVRVHFCAHAHVGDRRWAGKDAFRKIACVDEQAVPQVNVASLDNDRGSQTRSVILELYADGTLGIYFRDHESRRWPESYHLTPRP